jgi:uncharacterized membrane protein (UPF0127 family)
LIVANRTKQTILADHVAAARTFWQRLRGLMGKPVLRPGEGLVLFGDNSIHTFFMRFPIDVLYLDGERRVLRLQEAMPPWKVGPMVRSCRTIVELPPGTIQSAQTSVGDIISLT